MIDSDLVFWPILLLNSSRMARKMPGVEVLLSVAFGFKRIGGDVEIFNGLP